MVLFNGCFNGRCSMRSQHPQCLPKDLANICQTIRCGQGYECRLVHRACSSWPCFPEPECLPRDNRTTLTPFHPSNTTHGSTLNYTISTPRMNFTTARSHPNTTTSPQILGTVSRMSSLLKILRSY
ncbi:hypothetical protein COOONC_16688 [Cooperia oncophora]